MYYKVGEIKPYAIGRIVYYGKILKVNEDTKTYLIKDLETNEQVEVDEKNVFIGDD